MKEYSIDNSIEKILSNKSTNFLMLNEFNKIRSKLKKNEYKIYLPYRDSDKVILYNGNKPKVLLYKIICDEEIRHQDILGSIFALGISNSFFGDIVKYENEFYIYILPSIEKTILTEFKMVGNKRIELQNVSLELLKDFEKQYEKYNAIISSLRLDIVIGKITNKGRKDSSDYISNKLVLVNSEVVTKNDYTIKENDVLSIRKYGRYKFIKVVKNTKSDKLLIEYIKYI